MYGVAETGCVVVVVFGGVAVSVVDGFATVVVGAVTFDTTGAATVLVVVVGATTFGAWMVFDVRDVIGDSAARFFRASSSVLLMYVAMVTILQGKREACERSQLHQISR
jgi:hypothetical protein